MPDGLDLPFKTTFVDILIARKCNINKNLQYAIVVQVPLSKHLTSSCSVITSQAVVIQAAPLQMCCMNMKKRYLKIYQGQNCSVKK